MPYFNDKHQDVSYAGDCIGCIYFQLDTYQCLAFPEGIPKKLLSGEIKHRKILNIQEGTTIFKELGG